MNVFKRIGDIVSSNINAALDKMEDPEKMLDLSIREMEDAINEIKCKEAEKSYEIRALEKALKDKRDAIERWKERAELAAGREMDDMAREAISEKLRLSDEIRRDEEALSALKNLVDELKSRRCEAEEKLKRMKEKASELRAYAKSAKEKKKAADIVSKSDGMKYERRMAEIRAKIDKWEAEADASLKAEPAKEEKPTFEELERQDAIEKELKALKERAANR